MKKLLIALLLTSCMEIPEPIVKEIETEVYKPTRVAVKFLSSSDEWQTLEVDTIYLDRPGEELIWDADEHPNMCIDKVSFKLVEL